MSHSPGQADCPISEVDCRADGLVIFSASEAEASGDGAGFWSNLDGWTGLDAATWFSDAEAAALSVPMSSGNDAAFVTASEAAAYAQTSLAPAAHRG